MSNITCFNDIGCDVINLRETDASGGVTYFVRKICRDMFGNYTTQNLNLDGSPKTIGTDSIVTPVGGGDEGCAATVNTVEYWDLNPGTGNADPGAKICAKAFLRHFVYDCSGKISEFYDTTRKGLAYVASKPVECAGGALPSVVVREWPYQGYEIDPEDNGQNQNYIYHVQDPKTGEVMDMKFFTQTPVTTEYCFNPEKNTVSVNADISASSVPFRTGNAWKNKPRDSSLFTYTLDPNAAARMSALRLEFNDLDGFEGVWGLDPWPDAFAVFLNGVELNVDDILVFDEEVGAFKPNDGNPDNTVHAYYYNVPTRIQHWYHNASLGRACHSGAFTAFTYEEGPCCDCCDDGSGDGTGGGCQNWTATQIVHEDVNATHDFDLKALGEGLSAPYEGSFLPGVQWSVDSGSDKGFTPGYEMLSEAAPLCTWRFSEAVNLEFGITKAVYGYGRMALPKSAMLLSIRDDRCEWDSTEGVLDVFTADHTPMTDTDPYARFRLNNVKEITFKFLYASTNPEGYNFSILDLKATSLRGRLGFMRSYTYDCNNELIAMNDYSVDGTPYVPAGSIIFK